MPDFHNSENLQTIRDVIIYRLNRNKLATLNSDMNIEYGVKIPPSGAVFTAGYDPDIEWIVSASASSASASNLSSARSQKSIYDTNTNGTNANNNNNNNVHRLNDNNISISSGSFRRSSGNKRLPWEDQLDNQTTPKVVHSREVAPLKAFPLHDEFDFVNASSNFSNGMHTIII